MNFDHDIQALSTTISESNLCLFSFQIEWVFKRAHTKTFDIEYRHFGIFPLNQLLVNGNVISSSLRSCNILNFSHKIDGMKLQIKQYGKNYNLLINGQDFDSFVPHLKTIQEIQEPLNSSRDYNPIKIHSTKKIGYPREKDADKGNVIENSKSGTMFSTKSSSGITFTSNFENVFQDVSCEEKVIEECVQVLAYLEGFSNEKIVYDDDFLMILKKVYEKINSLMRTSTSDNLNLNLQNLKKKINETLYENLNIEDLRDIGFTESLKRNFKKNQFGICQ